MGIGSFLSAFISFGIFGTYENILNINFLYFFISSFAFLSINILGNLFKGYEKFNFLIYVNLLSFSISILYLIFNTEGDDYIVFNTWLIFCVLTIIQNFLFYLFIRKQIPNKSKGVFIKIVLNLSKFLIGYQSNLQFVNEIKGIWVGKI